VTPTARTEQSVAEIARAYFESPNTHDTNAMMDFWQPGGEAHIYGIRTLRAPEGYHEWFGAIFRAIPDIEFEVLDVVAEGERAVVRWRASGTFDGEGEFEGVKPTGASVSIEGLDLLTIRDGLIQENLAYTNGTEIGRQLGVLPPAGSFGERAMLGAANARNAAAGLLRRLRSRE
jgi:predicted ester cyclase